MGSFQRFDTGFISSKRVRQIPSNPLNLTRTDSLAVSIQEIDGVVEAKVKPGFWLARLIYCRWQTQSECGTDRAQLRAQVETAIARCCDPASHVVHTPVIEYEEELYTGFAGI